MPRGQLPSHPAVRPEHLSGPPHEKASGWRVVICAFRTYSTPVLAPSVPLTVAFITDAPRVAGSEIWLWDVLPRLKERGLNPSVYLPRAAPLDELATRFEQAGVPTCRYDDRRDLPALTRDADLRVLQVWDPATYQALLPTLRRPRAVIVHDQLEYHYPLGVNRVFRAIYRHTKARQQRRADRVITVSHWGQAFLTRHLGLRDVHSVQNGVNPERFRPADGMERQGLRADLQFRRFTVLVPGRFALEKNQMTAVLTARHAPELDFVFAGDMDSPLGTLALQLRHTYSLENVRFLGRRWDMPELYRAADALLQPTLAENQSLVTLEAMSSGLPIVTTAIPAQAELVQDGVTGLLVPARPELLAQALQALATHPQRTRALGAAARDHVLAHHTLERTADGVARALREAARA